MNLSIYTKSNVYCENFCEKVAFKALFDQSLLEDKVLYRFSMEGVIDKAEFDIYNFIESSCLNKKYVEDDFAELFLNQNTALYLTFSNNNYSTIDVLSTNADFVEKCKGIEKYLKKIPDTSLGKIFCISQNGHNLYLSSIGLAGIDFNEKNYTKQVVKDYKYIVKDLKSKKPSGRIAIFEGQPGSGKTHLIRSLLSEIEDTTFILVPPDLVKSLAGPNFIPLLLSHHLHNDKTIVLVLEDADECLVKRGDKNMNSIQALLNLSDGIIGSMLDLRVVATTNATKLDFEPAILRSGRLSKRVEVNFLSENEANDLLFSLFDEIHNFKSKDEYSTFVNFKFDKPVILADVYAKARELGWEEK
jgi:hypothetical protein